MANPRLPFLWPMLFRAVERSSIEARPIVRRRAIHVSSRRRQETISQRYGTANEPPPPSKFDTKPSATNNKSASSPGAAAPTAKVAESESSDKARSDNTTLKDADRAQAAAAVKKPITFTGDPALDAFEDTPEEDVPALLNSTLKQGESLLDNAPDPASPNTNKDNAGQTNAATSSMITHEEHSPPVHAPHMEAPRHVHHFDTYGLVKQLEDSGWKNDQAITLMKAVRLMLADNMNLAREALVSKSQVENETYLFKAACSELRTEVTTRRHGEQDKMRTQRTQLQHELDLLNQRLTQESATLKDDLKGMFDDRKISIRNEQRAVEGKIQELNYQITVSLQADSKSDVEALRWIMTRRVIITLGLIVIMVLSSLKLYSNAVHERELEQKRRSRMKNASTQVEDAGVGPGPDMVNREMLVREGDNPAYVSLG